MVDLPVFGCSTGWRWRSNAGAARSCRRCWCDEDPEIAPPGARLTTRAARWSTFRSAATTRRVRRGTRTRLRLAHRDGRRLVIGEQLIDHPDRFGDVTACSATLFARVAGFRTQSWSTQIVDVRRGHLLDVVPGRTASRSRAGGSQNATRHGSTASSGPPSICRRRYRSVFDTMFPHAVRSLDPFHVHQLANRQALTSADDECRTKRAGIVADATIRSTGPGADSAVREGTTLRRSTRSGARSAACRRPQIGGVVRMERKKVVRQIYDHTDPELADAWVAAMGRDFTDLDHARRGPPPRTHHGEVGRSDLCVACSTCLQRTDRSGQQLTQAHRAGRVRLVNFLFVARPAACSTPADPTGPASPPSNPETREPINAGWPRRRSIVDFRPWAASTRLRAHRRDHLVQPRPVRPATQVHRLRRGASGSHRVRGLFVHRRTIRPHPRCARRTAGLNRLLHADMAMRGSRLRRRGHRTLKIMGKVRARHSHSSANGTHHRSRRGERRAKAQFLTP